MNAPLRSGPRRSAPVARTARSACSPASQKENTPMTPWTLRIAALALATSAGTAFAHGNVECKPHPQSEWRPHTELEQKLVKEGWKIRRMEKTDSCYEVYAKTPDGKRVEAFFDPKTFERVEE